MTYRATALIGRDRELEILAGFLEQAAAEGGAFLLVGEPGAGKTALLDAAADAAEETGIRVLRAGGVEFEADLTYSGLNQVLLPVFGQFERLGATHRDALNVALGYGEGPPPDRLLVSTATLTVLRQAAAARPVLMIVDDLPWLDRASAGVLGFVARRLAGSRVGFLAALRPGEESFFERAGLPQHELGPLDEQAANALVSSCFPELAPRVRLAGGGGGPGEPAGAAGASGDAQRRAARCGRGAARGSPAQPAPAGAVRIPGRGSSRAARRLLLLAVLEGSGDLRVLQAAAGPQQIEDLAPAEQAGLVRVDDRTGRLVFRHPLTRSAIVELSTSGERRRAHRALAAQLADQPERRAWHLGEAAVEPDEQIAGLLEETAQRTLRRADAVGAVSALLRAAELSPAAADRSRRLAQAAAVGAAFSLETDTVSKLLRNAGEASPESATYLLTAVAAAFVLLNGDGDVITAHRLLTQAIEDQARPDRISDTGVFEAVSGLFLMCRLGGTAGIVDVLSRRYQRVRAGCARGPVSAGSDLRRPGPYRGPRFPGRRRHRRPAQRDGPSAHPDDQLNRPLHRPAARLPGSAVASGPRRPAGSGVAPLITALDHLGLDAWLAGHWDQAQELADEGLELSLAHGYPLLTWAFRYRQALIAAACGAYDGAHTLTDEMLRWAAPRRIGQAGLAAHHVGSVAALGRGDFEDAYQHATAISPAGVLASHVPLALWVLDGPGRGRRPHRPPPEAAAHVTAMRDAGIAAISPRLALLAAGSEAIATADEHGLGLFEEALAIPGVDRFPFDLARVQFLYGERLRRARSTKESRPHLAAALEIFERLGARPWAGRAARELQATGQTNAFPDQPARDSLTPQERQIAMLAAAGMSNKEIGQRLFLSHRTVGAHLYQIFPKLGIRSRAALRDALAELPEPLHARSQ